MHNYYDNKQWYFQHVALIGPSPNGVSRFIRNQRRPIVILCSNSFQSWSYLFLVFGFFVFLGGFRSVTRFNIYVWMCRVVHQQRYLTNRCKSAQRISKCMQKKTNSLSLCAGHMFASGRDMRDIWHASIYLCYMYYIFSSIIVLVCQWETTLFAYVNSATKTSDDYKLPN